jgi:hypothetical protein
LSRFTWHDLPTMRSVGLKVSQGSGHLQSDRRSPRFHLSGL